MSPRNQPRRRGLSTTDRVLISFTILAFFVFLFTYRNKPTLEYYNIFSWSSEGSVRNSPIFHLSSGHARLGYRVNSMGGETDIYVINEDSAKSSRKLTVTTRDTGKAFEHATFTEEEEGNYFLYLEGGVSSIFTLKVDEER